MRLIIGNVTTRAVAGGTDNLLPFDVMKELREYLRIRPENYHRSKKYQDGQWDGWRYFITAKGNFATGFLPFVVQFLTDNNVQITVEDNRGDIPKFPDKLEHYIGNIDSEDWEARDYQLDTVGTLDNYLDIGGEKIYFPRGIFDAATNAGKNSIAAIIAKNMDYDTIFMVSNTTIFKQAVEFFSQVLGYDVGQIRSGKFDPKKFTVCMVKSLYNQAQKSINVKAYLKKPTVLIVDESDEAGAEIYSKVLQLIHAPIRVFVSGTPLDSKKVNNMVAIGLSGPILKTITNKFLIENKYSQKPTVRIRLNSPRVPKFLSYSQEVEKIVQYSPEKMYDIRDLIMEYHDKQILITFNEKEHGYFMYHALKELLPDLKCGIIHGESPDREELIAEFKNGSIQILLSSMILKRGANIKGIQVLIRAEGGKSKTTTKQISGRALRHDGISDEVIIVDFYDDGKYVGKHSRDRIRIYKNEGFDVEVEFPTYRGKPVK